MSNTTDNKDWNTINHGAYGQVFEKKDGSVIITATWDGKGFKYTSHYPPPKTDKVVEDSCGLKTGIMSQMDMYNMGYKDGVKYAQFIKPEQPTNDNAFVWTDALVMEIIGLTHRAGYHKEPARVYERIQSFKQSKQSAPEPSALPTKGNTVTDNSDVALSCQEIYNQAIDHAIKIVEESMDKPEEWDSTTQIINSLTNLKQ